MTLDRALSRAGVASRGDASEMIRAGRVSIDGRTVKDPMQWVEPARQVVRIDGRRLQPARKIYYALHKPKGVITSHGDPSGRKTVYDLLAGIRGAPVNAAKDNATSTRRKAASWLFPVGRLDQDTTGLLLLTNDSVFAERITNPTTKVNKTYWVKVNALLAPEELERLRSGLDIGRGEESGPADVAYVRDNGRFCWIELRITEGKNRQVRRVIEALGHKVLKLTRVRIGKLSLGDMPPGALREIRPSDVI